MNTVHGSGAAVSASNASNGGQGNSARPKNQRYSSRSNSISSASVVTVKRAGSLSSSGAGTRNSAIPIAGQAPSDASLIALRVDRELNSQDHKRRRSVAVDSIERVGTSGSGTASRHSHSSVASAGNTRRSRASSGAVLPGLMAKSFSPQKRVTGTVDYSPRVSPKRQNSRPTSQRRHSPTPSPERERRRRDLENLSTALPPFHATPALTDPDDTESPSTNPIATPSTQSSYAQNYFVGDRVSPQSSAKSKLPVTTPNLNAPAVAVSHDQAVEGAQDRTLSNGRSGQRDSQITQSTRGTKSSREHEKTSTSSTAKESNRHRHSRPRDRSERDKKTMLSKALQKANTAVLLDNEQNFEGALRAYDDACKLLQQVMDRSSGPDDKRKLDAIRETYTNRIDELRQLAVALPVSYQEKTLPQRPKSDDSSIASPMMVASSTDGSARDRSGITSTETPRTDNEPTPLPTRNFLGSFLSDTETGMENGLHRELDFRDSQQKPVHELEGVTSSSERGEHRKSSSRSRPVPWPQDRVQEAEPSVALEPPSKTKLPRLSPPQRDYMPAPLSPRRPSSPRHNPDVEQPERYDSTSIPSHEQDAMSGAEQSNVSAAWLDTIDETASSCGSSVHSISSHQGLHRKHIRGASGDTNPDFDAAFDAAVEAALNEGFEPDLEAQRNRETDYKSHKQNDSVATSRSTAQENELHHAERPFSMTAEDEEEERILDDITHDFAQSFNFDLGTKSALPRQSDSSGYSRSTWQSSQVSDRTTAGTSLSTVAEDTLPAPISTKNAFASPSSNHGSFNDPMSPPTGPPPQSSLPKPPAATQHRTSGIRSRRLSGQNLKQLKIETSTMADARKRASTFHQGASPFKEDGEVKSALDRDFKFGGPLVTTTSDPQHDGYLRSPPSLDLRSAVSDSSRPMTATTTTTSQQRESFDDDPAELIMHRPAFIKKNNSSASLREHTLLIASPIAESGPSLVTPMSSTFMTFAPKARSNEAPLASQRAALPSFGPTAADSFCSGGAYLFNTSLSTHQAPNSPRSPGPVAGLEPCPESTLLRPFWLMRNIASTLMHPKGGFLTTQLFVPREVWQTKGVKLKNIEDKIANCDLLTAALLKLAGVDTNDADAVMQELQSFEGVMDQAQSALVKKLGSDVGVSGLHGILKDAVGGTNSSTSNTQVLDATAGAEKASIKEGKSYFNSWRKLRSKSSGAPMTGLSVSKLSNKAHDKHPITMPTVPMTSFVPIEQRRGHKKDARNIAFEGPYREYMGSLARLFDSMQVLDHIARQVEDPGLKGTSTTHVAHELSIRHAAEFFAFYVCRFVLADLGILIDKFIKRGTTWVLT